MPRPLLFQAPHEPIAEPQTGLISRAWYMWLMQFIQEFTTAGDVFGPGSSTDNAIARWDGATGTMLQNSNTTLSDAGLFAFADGVRQIFNPDATNAGLNVGAVAGNPSSLVNADIWYDSSTNELKARINGVTVVLANSTGTGGGAQLHGLQRVLGDGATTAFNLLDFAEYLEHVGVNGSFRDPATFALSADRSQIVFAAAPNAGEVIAIEYVTALS